MERIGRYQVDSEIGRGAMSIVYKVFDSRIDRYLAVKVLRERFARDVAARQRFLGEARAAGGLGHPAIVTVFDVGQADGLPYLVMELLEGETLADRLGAAQLPDLRHTLDIAIQVAGALSYAHDRGVIHRDIKPANIQFDPERGQVKLLDFGIAAVGRSGAGADADSTLVVGTPGYMAPEQITGEPQDARCDLYALGALLYRLLSGHLPFEEGTINEQMASVLSRPAPPLKPMDPHTPVELIELVHRLLSKQAAARPASAADVLEELQDIRIGLDRGLLAAARRRGLAWRWPLLLGGLLALVLALGLGHVYRSQSAAMTSATFGFGEGLASVIARELAEPLLLDDNVALATLVSDFSSNVKVLYLHVADRTSVVQASTDQFLQGDPVPRLEAASLLREESAVRVLQTPAGDMEFQVPIRFQGRRIGDVHLGLDGSGLSATARSTLGMMVVVLLTAMLATMLAAYLIQRHQRRLLERLGWGLKRIGKGQYDFRLEADRRDEFGALYRHYNDMAMRLEARHGSHLQAAERALPRFQGEDGPVQLDATSLMVPESNDAAEPAEDAPERRRSGD